MDCRLLPSRQFALLCTLVLIATIGMNSASGETLRVGLIEPIDGCGVPIQLLPELQNKLAAVDGSGALGNTIHLSRCQPLSNSNGRYDVAGACGRPVSLPEMWSIESDHHFYRGVACGPNRPGTAIRRSLIGQPPEPWGMLKHQVDFNFPSDVIAMIDENEALHVGCDWNADLKISSDELLMLAADDFDRPRLFRRNDAIVLIQASWKSSSKTDSDPVSDINLHLWTVTGTAQDRQHGWNQTPLAVLLNPSIGPHDCDLVWLDIGGLMPADLAAAMNAARDLDCDVVLVNLNSSGDYETDIARLLGELSHACGVPVVVNQRTAVSPDFLVHPARTTIADLAESRFANEPETGETFGRRIKELFSHPTLLQDVVHETLGTTHQQLPDGETIRAIGGNGSQDTLPLSDETQISRLARHPETEVPDAVRLAASHLLDRGPLVRSWWYRAAPRNGSIDSRPLFQEIDDQLPHWDDSHLQYWTITESGWLDKRSGRMGDLGLSWPHTAWILLQAAADPSTRFAPPQLVESLSNDRAENLRSTVNATADHNRDGQPNAETGSAIRWPRSQISQNPVSDRRDWLWYYDHDATAEFLQQSIQAGSTASDLLNRFEDPGETSDDLTAWRRHLLALDEPSLRKHHLDHVVAAAEKALQLCENQLGGLPSPEDPYHRDSEATTGPGNPGDRNPGDRNPGDRDPGDRANPPSTSAYMMPTTPEGIQIYAWAADAAYRKVRAIGYRELPDVVIRHPIQDKAAQDREFESAFAQLCGIVDIRDHRFALTLVRYERRRGNPSRAYEALWRHATEGPSMPWYFKKERDLWADSGWEPLRRLGHARWFLREANQPVIH